MVDIQFRVQRGSDFDTITCEEHPVIPRVGERIAFIDLTAQPEGGWRVRQVVHFLSGKKQRGATIVAVYLEPWEG